MRVFLEHLRLRHLAGLFATDRLHGGLRDIFEEHCEACEKCSNAVAGIRGGSALASHLRLHQPPAGLWPAIQRTWEKPVRRRMPRARIIAAGIALASVIVLILVNPPAPATAEIRLDRYLQQIEACRPENVAGALFADPGGFTTVEQKRILPLLGNLSLPAFEKALGAHRSTYAVATAGRTEVARLAYETPGGSFCLFVAPRSCGFDFGGRDTSCMMVDRRQCSMVECTRATILTFGKDDMRCVMVGKFEHPGNAAAIVRAFSEGQQNVTRPPDGGCDPNATKSTSHYERR